MTITPEQARKWIALWNDPAASVATKARAVMAAPEMAETIAGMKFEHAVEMHHEAAGAWVRVTDWIEVREVAEQRLHDDDGCRLVRRLVSAPVEVIDGE